MMPETTAPETSTRRSGKRLSRTRMVAAALAVSLAFGTTGCGRTGWELFGAMVEIAAYVAVTAMVLAVHDHHYHSYHCGHPWVVYEERPVYNYGGRWEYYEPQERTWYYYPDGVPGR